MPSLAADCIPHICQLQCLPHHASGVQQAARSSHRPEPTGPSACQRATLLFVLCECSAAQPLASDSFRESRLAVQVFCAVADAQEKLGFRHWDLRLANVMQHTPLQRVGNISEAAVEADSAKPESAAQPELQYKVIDFGHGNLYDRQLKRYDRKASWWLPGFCTTPDLHWLCGWAAVEQGDNNGRVIVCAAYIVARDLCGTMLCCGWRLMVKCCSVQAPQSKAGGHPVHGDLLPAVLVA